MSSGLVVFYIIGVVATLSTALLTFIVAIRYNFAKRFTCFFYILILFSGYMFFAQYFKCHSLHFYSDFAHWAQVLHSISVIGKPWAFNMELMVPGTLNYFSLHFVPYTYLLAIPYRIWSHNETIIVMNFLLMISSAIPLYKLTLACHKNKQFALFLVVLLFWYPTFQYLVLYEFEMLRLSVPIILWMLYFWQQKKIKCYYLFVVLAVLVREEVGLTIFMFGIYLMIAEGQRRTGLISAVIGLTAFVVITQMIMPLLRSGAEYEHIAMSSFSALGNTFGEIIMNIIRHPISVIITVLQPIKLANVFMFFLPVLFIPLFAPAVLIAVLANFGVGLLSGTGLHVSYMLYYLAPSVPFIFYAFIKGWPRFVTLLETFSSRISIIGRNSNVNSTAMVMVLSGLLVLNLFFGPSPISLQFWFKTLRPAPFATQSFHYSVYKVEDHHRIAEEFANLIPDNAIVSAPQYLHPLLIRKRGAVSYPRSVSTIQRPHFRDKNRVVCPNDKYEANYVFFDKTNNNLIKKSTAYRTQQDFDPVENDKENWELVKSGNGYFLYKRVEEVAL
jgi:uncharacterized membrane protein